MATRTNRKTTRTPSRRPTVSISRDFQNISRDFGKLAVDLWRLPATKFVIGGAALAALTPMIMRGLRNHPEIEEFVHENVVEIRNKIDRLIHPDREVRGL